MERKLKAALPDTRTVDIVDAYTLDFWIKEFNVNETKLKAAVLAAGNSAADVKRELKK